MVSAEQKFREAVEELTDIVISNRPSQNQSIDQYFMDKESMVRQAVDYYSFLEGKNVIFLGDGDGASSHFELIAEKGLLKPMANATLFDIDERILNYHRRIQSRYCVDTSVLNFVHYNVLEPIPEEYRGKYELFYINPPYGSANNGNSTIVWIHRCLSACKRRCQGCIVIPNDPRFPWSVEAYEHIKEFVREKGFRIVHEEMNIHKYVAAKIYSSTLFVDTDEAVPSEYEDTEFPAELIEALYGANDPEIPSRIYDDGTEFGEKR